MFGSSSSYYSPHRCKFNSKRQSSTLNSIQKDKKGPRFPRHIAPTRKWARSSCISLSRESLLCTPVHADSRRTNSSCGLSAEALVHFL